MRNSKGITLISLVITIVILLILAAVALNLTLGENGLINRTQQAVEDTKKASAKEKLEVELLAIKTEKLSKNEEISLIALDENIDKLISKEITVAESGSPREVTLDGFTFKVKDDLTLEEVVESNSSSNSNNNSNTDTNADTNTNTDTDTDTNNNTDNNDNDNDTNQPNVEEPVESGNSSEDSLIDDSLLKCFLADTNFKLTIEDLFSNESPLTRILESNDNIDYILDNKDKYGDYILNNSDVMAKFASNQYAMNKMISSSDWTEDILSNNTAIAGLDKSNPTKVPTLSSTNTSKVIYSSQYGSLNIYAYRVFDGATSGEDYWTPAASNSYQNEYVGYDFTTPIWVYKIEANVSNGKQNSYYVIEGSNDRNTGWTAITDEYYQGGGKRTITPNNYNIKYRYYRLRFLNGVAQSGSGNTIVSLLQFYGR